MSGNRGRPAAPEVSLRVANKSVRETNRRGKQREKKWPHQQKLPEKTADTWRRHHWFPRQMTSEKRAQKFHTDDTSLPRFGYWRVIRMEFAPKPSLKGTGPWKVRSGLWAPERYLDIKSSVLHGPVALFSLPGWTGPYIFEYLNAKFQPVRSEITRFLYAGFYCMKNIYENYGMKNYMKEDHRNYRRKFYSWLPITRTLANSNLAPPRNKIDFPWISVIHLL